MSKTQISKWNYGYCTSNNARTHTTGIQIGDLRFFFSYNTVIAFRGPGHSLKVCENVWGTTTGKHLNWLQKDKKQRLNAKEFDAELNALLKKHNLVV